MATYSAPRRSHSCIIVAASSGASQPGRKATCAAAGRRDAGICARISAWDFLEWASGTWPGRQAPDGIEAALERHHEWMRGWSGAGRARGIDDGGATGVPSDDARRRGRALGERLERKGALFGRRGL